MKKKLCVAIAVILALSCFPLSAGAVELTAEDAETVSGLVYEADIPELHALLVSGLVSSRHLTELYIERINEYNGTYKCFITLCDDALTEAEKRDAELAEGRSGGMLFGIPVVISDDVDLAGTVTTLGKSKKRAVAEVDADVAAYLKNSGAVIVGKTNVSASNSVRYTVSTVSGETKNAYLPSLSAGGTSGGSAVAVSLNTAAAGIGTGVLYPAALNGCFALRPTAGNVSEKGVYLSDGGTVGSIARSVSDLAIISDSLSGGKTSYCENLNENSLMGVRIGVITELSSNTSFSPWPSNYVDAEVKGLFFAAVSALEKCGAEVVEISIPNLFLLYFDCYKSGDEALVAKEKYYSAFRSAIEEASVSAVIFPTYLSAPTPSGRNSDGYLKADYEPFVNTSAYLSEPLGIPELTVPVGKHSSGASVGMEIAASRGEEQTLFNIAYSFESRISTRETPTDAKNLHTVAEGMSAVKLMFKYRTGPFEFLNSINAALGLK